MMAGRDMIDPEYDEAKKEAQDAVSLFFNVSTLFIPFLLGKVFSKSSGNKMQQTGVNTENTHNL